MTKLFIFIYFYISVSVIIKLSLKISDNLSVITRLGVSSYVSENQMTLSLRDTFFCISLDSNRSDNFAVENQRFTMFPNGNQNSVFYQTENKP